ncbi:MAG: hypothetical protein AAGK04_06530 [Planctomycetota bacterium]
MTMCCAGVALAQSPSPAAPPATPPPAPPASNAPASDADLLRGPSVERSAAPLTPDTFGGMQPERGAMADRVPHAEFMGAVRSLRRQDDTTLRLTREQQTKIFELHRAFLQEQRSFRDQNKDALDEMGGPRRGRTAPNPSRTSSDQLMDPATERAPERARDSKARSKNDRDQPNRTKRKEKQGGSTTTPARPGKPDAGMEARLQLLAKAPSPADTQRSIWAELTPPQREVVERALAARRTERESKRDAKTMERYREQARDRFKKAEADEDGRMRRALERLPAGVRAEVEALSPEARLNFFVALRDMTQEERRALLRQVRRGEATIAEITNRN